MKRILLLVLLAVSALAGERFDQQPLAEGHIESVDTHRRFITLSEGALVVDISSASVRDALNHETSRMNLHPGLHVALVFDRRDYQPGDVLTATVIQILQQGEGQLTGPVQSVDPNTMSFQVNGLRIETDQYTYFVGVVPDHDPRSVAEMKVGDNVTVNYSAVDVPIATRIYTLPPTFEDATIAFTSTLRKIEGHTLTVRAVSMGNRTITTFQVVSGTNIVGFLMDNGKSLNPASASSQPIRPGDVIQVTARIDGDQITAENIELAHMQCPNFEPFPILDLHGLVTAISATSVTIEDAQGNFTTIILNDDTVYVVNNPMAGDVVDVQVEKHGDTYIGRSISIDQSGYRELTDVVKAIDGSVWTIGTKVADTNSRTEITGNPKVGDTVKLVYIDSIPGHILALRIDKQ